MNGTPIFILLVLDIIYCLYHIHMWKLKEDYNLLYINEYVPIITTFYIGFYVQYLRL